MQSKRNKNQNLSIARMFVAIFHAFAFRFAQIQFFALYLFLVYTASAWFCCCFGALKNCFFFTKQAIISPKQKHTLPQLSLWQRWLQTCRPHSKTLPHVSPHVGVSTVQGNWYFDLPQGQVLCLVKAHGGQVSEWQISRHMWLPQFNGFPQT